MTRYTILRPTPSYVSEKKKLTNIILKEFFTVKLLKAKYKTPTICILEVLCFVCKEVFFN